MINIDKFINLRKVLDAFIAGEDVEMRVEGGKGWVPCYPSIRVFDLINYEYRVVEKTKPSIDWNEVSEKYNYLAHDYEGNTYLYGAKPLLCSRFWMVGDDDDLESCPASAFKSFNSGTIEWDKSLVMRPFDDDSY